VTSSDYSQAALDRRLLAAANTLRGPVDPADFKAYVFPLLFFKRISKTWGWKHERALDAFGGNEELAAHPDNATPDRLERHHEQAAAAAYRESSRVCRRWCSLTMRA
jgi:type I restriction-modification system DNA methylase subunit